MTNFNQELDASGLNCPLPIIKARKALNTMNSGEKLRVITTDPGSVADFEAFARQTGNQLLESDAEAEGNQFYFMLEKS